MIDKIEQACKEHILMYVVALLIILVLYPFNFMNNIQFALLLYWGLYGCQYLLFKKFYKKELLGLIGIITLNMFLNKLYIYFRLDIQLAIYFSLLAIYYVFKSSSKYRWQKILSIALVITLLICINYYLRKDKLINDRGLEKCIKKELYESWNTEDITISNLEKIRHLYIGTRDYIYNLEGIENLNNLERLSLYDAKRIRNYDMLVSLPNLKVLSLQEVNFDKILKIGVFKHLEKLQLNDFKISIGLTNETFPKLKRLEMSGTDLNDLSFIKDLETLEELDLSFCNISSLNDIEKLKNLKKLEFYRVKIGDISKVKELKLLEEVKLSKSEVDDVNMLKKLPNIKRLKIQ